jgi:hypothetical protein
VINHDSKELFGKFSTVPLFVLVALAGAGISLSRILVINPGALSELVWAEDGLFPLCIKNYGYFSCLVDPFAGYLLFLSRTLAWPVSLFPLSVWPLLTNLVAAIAIGLGSAFITWLLIRANVSRGAAVIAGLIPVSIPIVGFEAVNSSGSAYMIMLIIAAILVSFRFSPVLPVWVTPIFLLVCSLTIPSSAVLVIPLVFYLLTAKANRREKYLVNLFFLGIGLLVQFLVVITAENSRPIAITFDSLTQWVSQIPVAIATLAPAITRLSDSGLIESDLVSPNSLWGGGILVTIVLAVVFLNVKGNRKQAAAGWLIFVGFLMGLIPALAGYSNNRYFVVPLAVLLIGILVIADSVIHKRNAIVFTFVGVLLATLWLPAFGASDFRSQARPDWEPMLQGVVEGCETNSSGTGAIVFSPEWPFSDAIFLGPTSNVIDCNQLLGTG